MSNLDHLRGLTPYAIARLVEDEDRPISPAQGALLKLAARPIEPLTADELRVFAGMATAPI